MKTLDINQRYDIVEKIASNWTDRADIKELASYFFNAQFEYLDDLPIEELLDIAEEEGIKL
jgi:hypothetical protein